MILVVIRYYSCVCRFMSGIVRRSLCEFHGAQTACPYPSMLHNFHKHIGWHTWCLGSDNGNDVKMVDTLDRNKKMDGIGNTRQ